MKACPSLCESPGLVVIGGDSWIEGCWFESLHCRLDGHFSHLVVNFLMFVWKDENKRKKAGDGPFKKIVECFTFIAI